MCGVQIVQIETHGLLWRGLDLVLKDSVVSATSVIFSIGNSVLNASIRIHGNLSFSISHVCTYKTSTGTLLELDPVSEFCHFWIFQLPIRKVVLRIQVRITLGSWIRIRIKVESWIRIRIKVKRWKPERFIWSIRGSKSGKKGVVGSGYASN